MHSMCNKVMQIMLITLSASKSVLVSRACILLGLLTFLTSCKCAPPSVLIAKPSPNGKQTLTYSMDTCTRPNGSPIFDVSVRENGAKPLRLFETNNSNHHLKIEWLSEHQVLIDCSECTLSGSDVHFFRMAGGNVTVKYVNVPLDERRRK